MVDDFDVMVVGGGINGTGLARDLAGRGWRVLLAERDDLVSHTSSASTKLVHGGPRCLETYDFSLVRKAVSPAPMAARRASCSQPRPVRRSHPVCSSPNCAIWWSANGPPAPTTCCGGAASSTCTTRPRTARSRRELVQSQGLMPRPLAPP